MTPNCFSIAFRFVKDNQVAGLHSSSQYGQCILTVPTVYKNYRCFGQRRLSSTLHALSLAKALAVFQMVGEFLVGDFCLLESGE